MFGALELLQNELDSKFPGTQMITQMHKTFPPGASALLARKHHCQKHLNNSCSKFVSFENQFLGFFEREMFCKSNTSGFYLIFKIFTITYYLFKWQKSLLITYIF